MVIPDTYDPQGQARCAREQVHNWTDRCAREQVHNWTDFLGALESKCLTLVPWCETTWSEEMVKLRTGPFGPLVEEAFGKHGITQVSIAAQITEEKWKQARVPLQRALG